MVPRMARPTNGSPQPRDAPPGSVFRILIPVNNLARAKSRLPYGDLARRRLAFAFALDTIEAVGQCPIPLSIYVVTDDPAVAAACDPIRAVTGVIAEPRPGLPAAMESGLRKLRGEHPHDRAAVILGDLPAARPDELAETLLETMLHERAFLADADHTGTTLVSAGRPHWLAPAFGPDSADRHLALDYRHLTTSAPGVRRDVDDDRGLRAAVALGVGRHTRRALDALTPLVPALPHPAALI